MSANDKQVGGGHYKDAPIEVWDYIHRNGIGYLAGNAIKYLSRYQDKGGIEDLCKAKHYVEKLIEEETQPVDLVGRQLEEIAGEPMGRGYVDQD